MPIYAYRCEACGFAKDVLQKMSDEPLSVCPSCSGASFKKQVTAAGFQLKGSGWYVTDFRGGNEKANNSSNEASTTNANPASNVAPASTATSGETQSSSPSNESSSSVASTNTTSQPSQST